MNKDVEKKYFADLKNQLDMKGLRIHNSLSIEARLFVQFLVLTNISALGKKLRKTGLIDKYTFRELLEEMETIIKFYCKENMAI